MTKSYHLLLPEGVPQCCWDNLERGTETTTRQGAARAVPHGLTLGELRAGASAEGQPAS